MSPDNLAHSTLHSGAKLATACLPDRGIMALAVWVPFGSRHEPSAAQGVAHFLEHMVFKGTARRSARRISLEIESVGGEINAFTSEDHTCYHVTVPETSFRKAAAVLIDVFQNPRLAERDFAQERRVIHEEIQLYRGNPAQHVEDLLSRALWQEHPLGRLITGTPESLARISPATLSKWHQQTHHPARAVFACAGPWPHEKVATLLDQLISTKKNSPPRPPRTKPVTPPTPGPPRNQYTLIETRDIEQAHLSIGFRTPGRHAPQRFALRLLSVLLGESMGSRLFQRLREKHGLCYAIQSDTDLFDDVGILEISASLDPSRLQRACSLLTREIQALLETPPDTKELNRAKEYCLGQLALWLETTQNIMTWAGECLLHHKRILDPAAVRHSLHKVTPELIQAVAREIFQPENRAIAYVGPGQPPLGQWLD